MIEVLGPAPDGRVIAVNRGAPIKVLSSHQHQDHVDALALLGITEPVDEPVEDTSQLKVGDLLALRVEGGTAPTIVTVTGVNVRADGLSITAAQYPNLDGLRFDGR
ncbi:hypothetical protein BKP42_36140 [Rhodococcus erythropolis]|uniref:hypothetical protein n=1 Tax=Rhodococcus erythropolis TaxID=1833 RepID=UPI000BB3E356|nr:hypothetical protein [Rhodococcus erythropolis]PBI96954.1 hypothetical protein BKP42_36140 [Rhodococcus erythropolis]